MKIRISRLFVVVFFFEIYWQSQIIFKCVKNKTKNDGDMMGYLYILYIR